MLKSYGVVDGGGWPAVTAQCPLVFGPGLDSSRYRDTITSELGINLCSSFYLDYLGGWVVANDN